MTSCRECGKKTRNEKQDYLFQESGLDYVVLKGIDVVVCPGCKTVMPRIPRLNQVMRSLAHALIAKPFALKGQDVRFLRKFLMQTQDEFARILHVDKTTLSKWENGDDPVGPQSDRLIRLVALTLHEKLPEDAAEVVRAFAKIKRVPRGIQLFLSPDSKNARYVPAA